MANITEKNIFEEKNWNRILEAMFNLLLEHNERHHTNRSKEDLRFYAGEIFNWMHEAHNIYNYDYERLEELTAYIEEHALEIPWNNRGRCFIEPLWNVPIEKRTQPTGTIISVGCLGASGKSWSQREYARK